MTGPRTTPTGHVGPCCPACVKVAEVLADEGKKDDLYAGSARCCCRSDSTRRDCYAPGEIKTEATG